ncbi:hypothetical protein AKJ09_04852 [Labilithrix luteola]|uniref:Uncharacterized protein n=1 Tax=Labilithrix luteola TaxID=1391654 RepID=A0A0K1PXE1_9BACT|nr:hypothetical protein AKJ09_04852 [Labilithrix luteola]
MGDCRHAGALIRGRFMLEPTTIRGAYFEGVPRFVRPGEDA